MKSRFVVLHHEVGRGISRSSRDHYDWMFEFGGVLKTWATDLVDSFDQEIQLNAEILSDHRINYLDYEGEISRDRGRVRRVLSGTYELRGEQADPQAADPFEVTLAWRDKNDNQFATLRLYRNTADAEPPRDESRDGWCLFFVPGRNETKR